MSDTPPVYVGFWARVLAALVDTVLLSLLLGLAFPGVDLDLSLEQLQTMAATDPEALNALLMQMLGPAMLQLLASMVLIVLLWRLFAATPGKMLVGARIVDAKTLQAPGTGQDVARFLALFASLFVLPLLPLGLIWVAFDPRKQGWHDKLAGTLVIKKRA